MKKAFMPLPARFCSDCCPQKVIRYLKSSYKVLASAEVNNIYFNTFFFATHAMTIDFFQYCGLDWLATVLSLYGVDQLSKKRKFGFLVLTLANGMWFFIGIGAGSIAMLFSNMVFGYMNIKGHKRWSQDEHTARMITN